FWTGERSTRLIKRSTRRHGLSDERLGEGQSRQNRLCRELRPLPLGKAASTAARNRLCQVWRSRLPGLLEPLLELDQDRRIQEADARNRHARGFSRGKFPLHRASR